MLENKKKLNKKSVNRNGILVERNRKQTFSFSVNLHEKLKNGAFFMNSRHAPQKFQALPGDRKWQLRIHVFLLF